MNPFLCEFLFRFGQHNDMSDTRWLVVDLSYGTNGESSPGPFFFPDPSFPRFCVDCFISPDRSSLFPSLYLLPVSRFHSHPFLCCPGEKEEKEFAAASFKGLSQTVPRWLAVKLLLWMHVRMLKRSMRGTCGHKIILFGMLGGGHVLRIHCIAPAVPV